jgi:hypothetical protein
MRTPIRTFLFTALVFLGLATGVQAQDKYEFASVLQWGVLDLRISIEGMPFEKIPLGKDVKNEADHVKLFEHVRKMQDEGWEVYDVMAPDTGSMRFVLRRKKA